MKTIVIYSSQSGSTKQYAQWISQELNAELRSVKKVKPEELSGYDAIIYGGWIMAGGVNGVSFLCKNFDAISNKKLVVFTSALTAPSDAGYYRELEDRGFTAIQRSHIQFFHFHGKMDLKKLAFPSRVVMNMLISSAKKKPADQRTKSDSDMAALADGPVDYVTKEQIAPLVEYVKSLG